MAGRVGRANVCIPWQVSRLVNRRSKSLPQPHPCHHVRAFHTGLQDEGGRVDSDLKVLVRAGEYSLGCIFGFKIGFPTRFPKVYLSNVHHCCHSLPALIPRSDAGRSRFSFSWGLGVVTVFQGVCFVPGVQHAEVMEGQCPLPSLLRGPMNEGTGAPAVSGRPPPPVKLGECGVVNGWAS